MSCLDKILEAFPQLSKAEAKNLEREITNLQNEYNNSAAAYNWSIKRKSSEFQAKHRNALREKMNHTAKKIRNLNHIFQEGFQGRTMEGILSLIEHSNYNVSGRNVNLENIHDRHTNELTSRVLYEFRHRNLAHIVKNPDNMGKIAEAYDRLSDDFKNSADPYEQIAWVVGRLNTSVIRRLQAAGSTIEAHQGYFMAQTHDDDAILNNTDEWANDIADVLDWNKTFGEGSIASKKEAVDRLKQFANNIEGVGFHGPSLGKSGKRMFHFKSTADWVKYNEKYGHHNLMDGIRRMIDRSSKQIALHEILGSNPQDMINELKTVARNVTPRRTSKAAFEASEKTIDEAMDVFTGVGDRPGEGLVADSYKWVRRSNVLLSLAKLGRASFAAIEDFATSTLVHKMITGETIPTAAVKTLGNTLKALEPGTSKSVAEMFSIALEGHNRELIEAVGVNRDEKGGIDRFLGKSLDLMMTATGTTFITNTFRKSAALGASREFTKAISLDASARNRHQQQALDSVNLTDKDVATLRQLLQKSGQKVVDVTMIRRSDLEMRQKQMLADKVGGFYIQMVAMASPHMRNKQRRQMFRHLPKDNMFRVFAEALFLFKGTIGAIQELVTEAARVDSETGSLKTPTAYKSLASTLLLLGTTKFAVDKMKEYVVHGEIEDDSPEEYAKKFADALVGSGAAGIYGQTMIDAVMPRYGTTRVPSPFVEESKKLVKAGLSDKKGSFQKALYRNAPFMNIWFFDNELRRNLLPLPIVDKFED